MNSCYSVYAVCQPMRRLARWMCSLSVCTWLCLAGCNSATQPVANEATTDTKVASAESATVKQDQQETAALEQAGAKLTRDSSQQVAEADLREFEMTDGLAQELSKLDSLVKLTLGPSSMSIDGWKSLGKLRKLQQLDLRATGLGNEEFTALASAMPALRAVRLNGKNPGTSVDEDGLKALANCQGLKVLALDHLWVGGAALQRLLGNKDLSELYLAGTLADDDALKVIAGFPKLKKLRLAQTSVSGVGLSHIASLGIQDLDISECSQLTDEAMEAVAQMTSLTRLNLWRDAITDEGVKQLAALTKMQWLNLDNTLLSDAGLGALAGMSQLTFLHVGSTSVSDAGMPDLLPLKSLKDLKVTRTAVTDAGVKVVTDGIPGVDVQLKYIEGE